MALGIQFNFEVNDMVSGALDMVKESFDKAFDQDKTLAEFNAGLTVMARRGGELGDIAKEVFVEGWGESLGDVTTAIGSVGDQLLDLSDASPDEIKKITKSALDLAQVMQVDVTEVTRAAGQMMKNGLAPDAMSAFDTITVGARVGGNAAGDMLETFTEYGPVFSAIGVDGPTALFMMKAALDEGIVSSDKAADAINEFGILAIDGSKRTSEAYAALGLDANAMAQAIAGGGPAATEATSTIIQALGKMTDPVAQETAGIAFFGSMWEDAGARAILAMDPAAASSENLAGNTAELGTVLHDTATQKVEVMKRKVDEWITSLINTEGPTGTLAAFATTFGPQALTLAANIGVIALALQGVSSAAIKAAGGLGIFAIAATPIWVIAGALAATIVLIKTAISEIDHLKRNFSSLMSGNFAGATSLRSPSAMLGTGGGFRVPFMADGGMVTRPTLLVAGESGPEVITPLSKLGGLASGGDTYQIIVQGSLIHQDELGRVVQDAVAKGRRTGAITGPI